MVLGTTGYMSPEQVRGLAVDHRSDIFSFGAVFYEMLAGKRAFRGATPADTMSAILSGDPPELESGTRTIPPMLDRLVRRCLEKSPDERYQSARDIAFNLEVALDDFHGRVRPQRRQRRQSKPPPRPRADGRAGRSSRVRCWSGLAAGVTTMSWKPAPTGPENAASFRQLTFRRGLLTGARFAPDGQSIVYAAGWEGRPSACSPDAWTASGSARSPSTGRSRTSPARARWRC